MLSHQKSENKRKRSDEDSDATSAHPSVSYTHEEKGSPAKKRRTEDNVATDQYNETKSKSKINNPEQRRFDKTHSMVEDEDLLTQDSSFYKIDSLFSLNKAGSDRPTKIIVTDINEEAFRDFFQNIKNYFHVTHLVIDSEEFSTAYQNSLTDLIKNGLKSLIIRVRTRGNIETLLSNLSFYSSLEELSININDNELRNYEVLHKKCLKIIDRNKEVKYFLEKELPGNTKQIKELNISSMKKDDKLSDKQLEFLVNLGNKYHQYGRYEKHFHKLHEDAEFKELREFANRWNIVNLVSSGSIKELKLIYSINPSTNWNNRSETLSERLIDIAVRNKHIEVVKWLLDLGVEITCGQEDDHALDANPITRYSNISRIDNFPFMRAWFAGNELLKAIFLGNDVALYDALAWCIYTQEMDIFNKIYKEAKEIDIFKPLAAGKFVDFTLLQLIVYYKRTKIFLELTNGLSKQGLVKIATTCYPDKSNFPYNKKTILEVIIHRGLYDELATLILAGDEFLAYVSTNLTSPDLLHLIFDGAAIDPRIFDGYRSRSTTPLKKDLEQFKKCFELLIEKKIINLKDLSNLKIFDKKNNSQTSLLHFIIEFNLYSMIEEYVDLFLGISPTPTKKLTKSSELGLTSEIDEEKDSLTHSGIHAVQMDQSSAETPVEILTSKYRIESFKIDVNLLQFAVCKSHDRKLITDLYNYYQKFNLLNVIGDAFSSTREDLFQHALCTGSLFITLVVKEKNYPINKPFPAKHPTYPNWLPIQLAVFYAIEDHTGRLETLLKRSDIDFATRFLEGGDFSHNLVGFYPLSALFYSGYPKKNHHGVLPRILLSFVPHFVDLIKKSELSIRKKNEIYTEALLYAVHYHSTSRSHDHSEGIKLLLSEGANCFQNQSNGFRIIDIAYDKGLIGLFSSVLEGSFEAKRSDTSRLIENERASELNQVTSSSYHVAEDRYAVVSLVRNETSKLPDHVFLIVEKIIYGQSQMHFIDFVNTESKKGKVRRSECRGGIKDNLLYSCKEKYLTIESIKDIIAQSWQITIEACDDILKSIKLDEDKLLNYSMAGSHSMLGSLSEKGDNCYTWARRKLLASGDQHIKQQMNPTIEEWLATVPRLKLIREGGRWQNNPFVLFARKNIKTIGGAVGVGVGAAAIAYKYLKS